MESLINIAITVLLFVIIIILLTGLITMAIGGRFSPHFRNKLMRLRVYAQGTLILLIGIALILTWL